MDCAEGRSCLDFGRILATALCCVFAGRVRTECGRFFGGIGRTDIIPALLPRRPSVTNCRIPYKAPKCAIGVLTDSLCREVNERFTIITLLR